MENKISFQDVFKDYPLYVGLTGGFKNFLFRFFKTIREMRSNKFQALRGISFEIAKGEVVGIIGHNGAGKSTTLGLIAGVISPSKGTVKVNGRIAPLLELGAGFHRELTGRENIYLNGILLGLTKREVQERIEDIINFSELHNFIDQPIRTYSSGMVARLGFSVAVHIEPDILLVDEILAVGDEQFQAKCYKKIQQFKEQGVTIVIVSHNHKFMHEYCDRLIEIEGGKIINIHDKKGKKTS